MGREKSLLADQQERQKIPKICDSCKKKTCIFGPFITLEFRFVNEGERWVLWSCGGEMGLLLDSLLESRPMDSQRFAKSFEIMSTALNQV